MAKLDKSKLIVELEKYLKEEDYSFVLDRLNDVVTLIDVMANLRKLPVKMFSTFGEMISHFLKNTSKTPNGCADKIHILSILRK